MTLSEIIRAFRDAHDYTMQEFADRCGLSKGYISMLEKGIQPRNKKKIVPSIETIAKIASGMGMSPDELVSQLDGNQRIFVGREPSAPPSDELVIRRDGADAAARDTKLLAYYNLLNDDGWEKLMEYASDLVASGRYEKPEDK